LDFSGTRIFFGQSEQGRSTQLEQVLAIINKGWVALGVNFDLHQKALPNEGGMAMPYCSAIFFALSPLRRTTSFFARFVTSGASDSLMPSRLLHFIAFGSI